MSRFALSPLWELTHALRLLAGPSDTSVLRPWLARARDRYLALTREADVGVILALNPPGWGVDFLAPVPANVSTTIGDLLNQVRSTPAGQVQHEVALALAQQQRSVDPRIQRILTSDRAAGYVADVLGRPVAWSGSAGSGGRRSAAAVPAPGTLVLNLPGGVDRHLVEQVADRGGHVLRDSGPGNPRPSPAGSARGSRHVASRVSARYRSRARPARGGGQTYRTAPRAGAAHGSAPTAATGNRLMVRSSLPTSTRSTTTKDLSSYDERLLRGSPARARPMTTTTPRSRRIRSARGAYHLPVGVRGRGVPCAVRHPADVRPRLRVRDPRPVGPGLRADPIRVLDRARVHMGFARSPGGHSVHLAGRRPAAPPVDLDRPAHSRTPGLVIGLWPPARPGHAGPGRDRGHRHPGVHRRGLRRAARRAGRRPLRPRALGVQLYRLGHPDHRSGHRRRDLAAMPAPRLLLAAGLSLLSPARRPPGPAARARPRPPRHPHAPAGPPARPADQPGTAEPTARPAEHPRIMRATMAGNLELLADRTVRGLLLAQWLPAWLSPVPSP